MFADEQSSRTSGNSAHKESAGKRQLRGLQVKGMEMIDKPKVGQVWERDGLQREVTNVGNHPIPSSTPEKRIVVNWSRPDARNKSPYRGFRTRLPAWNKWKEKAHLVKEVDNE